MKRKNLITGALILTAASIITKILGFIYRIYMSNTIGAEGMGLYQLIVPIYTLAWSISSSGFSTTVSKLVSQENAKKEYGNMNLILKESTIMSALISGLLTLILFFFTDWIGIDILKDSRTVISLKIISLCFPFMAMGSSIRGYFYGLQDSTVPAISQVLEQSVRMIVIYLLADSLIPLGLEYACLAAVIGIVSGEIISFIFTVISFKYLKLKYKLNKKSTLHIPETLGIILSMSLPLTANRVIGSFLSTVENTLIPHKLVEYGYTSEGAIAIYGELCGMAMPLLQFPTAFLMALSITLVPSVSEAMETKNRKRINYVTSKALQFTALIGIGMSGIFIFFSHELGIAIYNNSNIGNMLFYMSWISPFLYLHIILSGILNGLGKQMFIFKNSLISSLINIIFIFFYIPVFGIYAYLAGIGTAVIVTSTLAVNKISECMAFSFDFRNWLIKPIIAIIISAVTAKYVFSPYILPKLPMLAAMFIILVILGLIYLLLLFIFRCFEKKDLDMLLNSIKRQ